MVLLIQKINKLYSKLENHYHHHLHKLDHPLPLRSALQAFRSNVSTFLTKLLLTPHPDSDILSLSWLRNCFQLLPIINDAFSKLVLDLDYPMTSWEHDSIQEYLSHSLNLLDILNSISSALASLSQSRLALSHALTLVINGSPSSAVVDRLSTTTQLRNFSDKVNDREEKGDGEVKNRSLCEKEAIIHEALLEMKSVGFWVSSIVLACLSGDSKAYLELEESARRPGSMACLTGIDTIMWGFVKEKEIVAKEVKDLNDSAAKLAAEISSNRGGGVMEAVEMQRKLDLLDKLVDGLTKDVDRLFSDILATRNELLRCFRI